MALIFQKSGCKVGWEFYDYEAEARARAKTAADERERKFAQGYDFGYQWPGAVDYMPNHPEFGECWVVIVP